MTLTREMQNCLDTINGANGIVAKISAEKHSRGDMTPLTSSCNILDMLAKVLFKGPHPTIYVSIIEDISQNKLIVSYPGTPNNRALTQEKVDIIIAAVSNVIINGSNPQAKLSLFKLLYMNKNDILIDKITNHEQLEKQKLLLREENQHEILKQLKHHLTHSSDEALDILLQNEVVSQIALEIFDEMLPDMAASLAAIADRAVEVMPHTTDQEHRHYGVHVEVKGIHHARETSPNSAEFRIGLARYDSKIPGCCTCCSAEFEALNAIRGLSISRSGDFLENFPPTNYKASSNVSDDELVFPHFVNIIYNKCCAYRDTSSCPEVCEHSFFEEAAKLIGLHD